MAPDILPEYLKADRERFDARDHGPVFATTIIKRKKAPRNLLRDSDNENNYDCDNDNNYVCAPYKGNIDTDNHCSISNDEDEDEVDDNNDYHHYKFFKGKSIESCINVKKQNNCHTKSLFTSSAPSSMSISAPLSHRSSSHSLHPTSSSSHFHSDPVENLPVCSKCGQETDVRYVEICFSDTLFILCL